jgi:hypothetical protein
MGLFFGRKSTGSSSIPDLPRIYENGKNLGKRFCPTALKGGVSNVVAPKYLVTRRI